MRGDRRKGPWPCGSGNQYKKYHGSADLLATTTVTLGADRDRRAETCLIYAGQALLGNEDFESTVAALPVQPTPALS